MKKKVILLIPVLLSMCSCSNFKENEIIEETTISNYKSFKLNAVNEGAALNRPKLGFQYHLNNDLVSIRYLALLNSNDVNCSFYRAIYDSNGDALEDYEEEEFNVSECYSVLLNDGNEINAIDFEDYKGDKDYNYFVTYTLKNIPINKYADYSLDCYCVISDDLGSSISSKVGSLKIGSLNSNAEFYSYERGLNADFTYIESSNTYSLTPLQEDVKELILPSYYSDGEKKRKCSISSFAFANCSELERVFLDKDIAKIGSRAFNENENLTIYTASESRNSSWNKLFNNNNLVIYNVPSLDFKTVDDSFDLSLVNDKYSLLKSKYSEENVYIKDKVNDKAISLIAEKAFYQDSKINSLIIDKNTEITSLPSSCFKSSSITKIYIPKNITYIASDCFESSSLTDIYYEGSLEEYESLNYVSNYIIHYNQDYFE